MAVNDAPTRMLGAVETYMPTPWLVDPIEYVPELMWPVSIYTYAKMRRDPTIKSVLNAYSLPILSAPWHVDPRGATPGMARIVADSLGLPVLGVDEGEGPVSTRWVRWSDHLRAALGDLVFGFVPFEPVYDTSTGTAYLSGLPERMPWSITEILVDTASGRLDGLRQARAGKTDVTIPADRLLMYVHQREGANWAGTSLLREAFGPWLFKQDAMRGQARTLRRFGSAVPVMEPVPGFNPTTAQITEAQQLASSYRGDGDRSGATTPGFRLRLVGVEGAMPDHLPFMRYCDEQIARSTLTSVLDLGSTNYGSRALGTVFLELMVQALQTVGEDHATIACQLARSLTDFNEGPDAEAPLIVVGDVASSRQTLASTIATLVQAGALTLDDALEGWVRDAFDLPAHTGPSGPAPGAPVPAGVAPPAAPLATPGPNGPAPIVLPVAAGQGTPTRAGRATQAGWPYRRPVTTVEAAAGLDPVLLDVAHDGIVAGFTTAWDVVKGSQVDAVVAEVQSAVGDGDLERLATWLPPYGTVTELLYDAVTAGFRVGVVTATAEAAGQGANVDAADPGPVGVTADTQDRYRAAAGAASASLASSLATGAMREAARLAGPATAPETVAAGVGTYLDGLTGTLPRDVAAGLVGAGIHDGRVAVMRAATAGSSPGMGSGMGSGMGGSMMAAVGDGTSADPGGLLADLPARFFASEIRDQATCEPCLAVDGTEYGSLDEAEAAYPTGGYTDCAGGLRCRGVIFATYGDATSGEQL